MGLLLSKNGIGPTEEKVKAVVEANQPQTLSQVHGILRFFTRLFPDFYKAADPVRKLARKGEPLFVVKSRSYLKI